MQGTDLMKVQFVLNVPETLALQDPSGRYNPEQEEVSYPCTDGRILTLETKAAERLNGLFLRPGETFGICRQWDKQKGTIPRFSFWLTPESEKARAAEEIASHEAQQPASAQVPTPPSPYDPPRPGKRQRRPKVQEMPIPGPAQPAFWDGRGNGTYGPAARPLAAAALKPPRIPYNVAFREVVSFVTAGLKDAGEQWSDQAKQDMVSTVLISASQQGLLQLWERP
jgi:hypothetical protein